MQRDMWEQRLSSREQIPPEIWEKKKVKKGKKDKLQNGSIHKTSTEHGTAFKYCQESPSSSSSQSDVKAWTYYHLLISHQLN